jgi:hypothetical protein
VWAVELDRKSNIENFDITVSCNRGPLPRSLA